MLKLIGATFGVFVFTIAAFIGIKYLTPQASAKSIPVISKGNSPVLISFKEVSKEGPFVTLEAQIQTQFDKVNLEWTLPEGVALLEGQKTEVVERSQEDVASNEALVRTIKIKLPAKLTTPHVVLFAYKPQGESKTERVGASRVFNLQKDPLEQEQTKMIQQHLQSRGVKPIK